MNITKPSSQNDSRSARLDDLVMDTGKVKQELHVVNEKL